MFAGLLLRVEVDENVEHGHGPVAPVAQEAEIGEGLLGRARLGLDLGQLVAELDEHLAVAESLVGRQRQYARHVVVLGGLLLLGEVADNVEAVGVVLGEYVEQEGVRVVVQEFVVEEELGEQAQVLRVGLVLAAVDLEERERMLAVDLVAGRMVELALDAVPLQALHRRHELQAVLAHVHDRTLRELLRIGREVPRLDEMSTQIDRLNVLDARDDVLVRRRRHAAGRARQLVVLAATLAGLDAVSCCCCCCCCCCCGSCRCCCRR